jgi:glycosyltransferase involved in cell wall biosynthesis
MRLLFATTYGHLPDVVGGLQTTVHELCLSLLEKNIEVRVLCGFTGTSDETVSHYPRSDVSQGYQVIRLQDPVESLSTVCAAFSPDAIIIQSGAPTVPMLLAALDTGIPTLLYLHNIEYRELGGILLPDPDVLYLANSEFTAKRMQVSFGINSEVLTPLVKPDLYHMQPLRRSVLYINPSMIKGAELAFQIAESLPDIQFQFTESWRLNNTWRKYCQRRAASLGNIEWSSFTRDPKVLYGDARLLLMPSIWEETYGRSVTEAQLSGIPVVSSNRGGLPETVGRGGELLDIHASVKEWVSAVSLLCADESYYSEKSEQAIAHASRDSAQPDNIINRLLELVQSHISSRR